MPDKKTSFPQRKNRTYYGQKPRGNQRRTSQGTANQRNTPRPTSSTNIRTKPQQHTAPQKPSSARNPSAHARPRRVQKQIVIPRRYQVWAVILVVCVTSIYFMVRKNGSEIFLGTESFGVIKSTTLTVDAVQDLVTAQIEQEIGTTIRLHDKIKVELMRISSKREKDVCTLEYAVPKIRDAVEYDVNGSNIVIQGNTAVTVMTEKEAEAVLEAIQSEYAIESEYKVAVDFVERVEVEQSFVSRTTPLAVEDAIKVLTTPTILKGNHTVKSGDTWNILASQYNTTTDVLLEYNQATINTKIIVGQILYVPISEPKLSVKATETVEVVTKKGKVYENQYDSSQPSTYQKIVQQGREEEIQTITETIYINGEFSEKNVISEKVIVEGIPEIILKGTG